MSVVLDGTLWSTILLYRSGNGTRVHITLTVFVQKSSVNGVQGAIGFMCTFLLAEKTKRAVVFNTSLLWLQLGERSRHAVLPLCLEQWQHCAADTDRSVRNDFQKHQPEQHCSSQVYWHTRACTGINMACCGNERWPCTPRIGRTVVKVDMTAAVTWVIMVMSASMCTSKIRHRMTGWINVLLIQTDQSVRNLVLTSR